MAKTRKEIQKAYRERQKAKGSEFLENERRRQRQYYVPAAELSEKKLKQRNKKNMLRNRLSRLKRKQQNDNNSSCCDETSGYESVSAENPTPLIVRLPSIAKSKGLQKTRKRALARANKSIGVLRSEVQTLQRRIKTKNKQIERMGKKLRNSGGPAPRVSLTPRKQAEVEVRRLNLTPRSQRQVKRRLVLSNAVMAEIKSLKESHTQKKRHILHRIVSGAVTKKYRCLNMLNRYTGLSRNTLSRTTGRRLENIREKRKCLSKSLISSVQDFMTRDDNSRAQPGKADVKKLGAVRMQTRVLTDYLKNLHCKYECENPNVKISLTTFCRLRPKHILLASFIARNTCQCIQHQNMALKVKALRKCGVKISENPENLLIHEHMDHLLQDLPETVVYKTWKKVSEAGKSKMKVVEESVQVEVFRHDFKNQCQVFHDHVEQVREQYKQIRQLKENLPDDDIIVQMDFAENFSCRSLDEIQTAYWNQAMVTLHPVVAYYREKSEVPVETEPHKKEIKHKSFVVVSDEMSHSAGTVAAFIECLVPILKEINPNVKTIHYWTDSPSSQYRNRFIFYVLANHRRLFGIDARWNYFEAGHGKGPCDGLGGTTKRMADEAIRQGNAVIQDAPDFQRWAEKSSMANVRFLYVSSDITRQKHAEFEKMKIKPLKNTMKLHAVGETENTRNLMTRETSCYCPVCLTGVYCSTWITRAIAWETVDRAAGCDVDASGTHNVVSTGETEQTSQGASTEKTKLPSQVGATDAASSTGDATPLSTLVEDDYVAAVYGNSWYIGKILDIDLEDKDCEITFMSPSKQFFRWPAKPDVLWISESNILCKVQCPEPCGKSRRLFKISDTDRQLVDGKFTASTRV